MIPKEISTPVFHSYMSSWREVATHCAYSENFRNPVLLKVLQAVIPYNTVCSFLICVGAISGNNHFLYVKKCPTSQVWVKLKLVKNTPWKTNAESIQLGHLTKGQDMESNRGDLLMNLFIYNNDLCIQ